MKKGEQFWNILTQGLDLADEAMPGQTIVEVTGESRVLIENHRGVKGYDSNRIIVCVHFGEVHVCGSNLELRCMSRQRLIIQGMICQISLHRRK